jgi:MFS transporter, OFA family, oxalate/formate antiporter
MFSFLSAANIIPSSKHNGTRGSNTNTNTNTNNTNTNTNTYNKISARVDIIASSSSSFSSSAGQRRRRRRIRSNDESSGNRSNSKLLTILSKNDTATNNTNNKNRRKKRIAPLMEPLRSFMSGIWDKSFDEDEEEEDDEREKDAAASAAAGEELVQQIEDSRQRVKVRKRFGYFGALILQMALGAFYCWSLFLVPLELSLNVGRAQLSAIFSLATLFFTISLSIFVPNLISRIRPETMCILATILATSGVFMASFCNTTMSIIPLYIGFAGLFGIACGLGYGLSQQMSSFAPFGQGLGTGLVTSARAFGAFVYAPMIEKRLDFAGPDLALRHLSYAIAILGIVASLFFHKASIDIPLGLRRRKNLDTVDLETLRRLTDLRPHSIKMWFVNALGCFAGICVISQSAVLLLSRGDASVSANVAAGVMYVSLATTVGRILGGLLCDRFKAKSVLIIAPLITAAAMFWASTTGTVVMPLEAIKFALVASGLSYGILQTAVPCEVRRVAGDGDFARAYGSIFTGFCFAGFFAPYVSGILFDAYGTYRIAFQISGVASLLSSIAACTLKGEAAVEREKRTMEKRAVEAAARNDTRFFDCTRTKENEWGAIEV